VTARVSFGARHYACRAVVAPFEISGRLESSGLDSSEARHRTATVRCRSLLRGFEPEDQPYQLFASRYPLVVGSAPDFRVLLRSSIRGARSTTLRASRSHFELLSPSGIFLRVPGGALTSSPLMAFTDLQSGDLQRIVRRSALLLSCSRVPVRDFRPSGLGFQRGPTSHGNRAVSFTP
jgi:hypothetical protein